MTPPTTPVRVRMAPSPTGYIQVGNARTAIFDWLFARHHGGAFLVRVEDTDRNRLVAGSVEVMLETLRWLGLDWDEGPEVGGPYGPYVQSERRDLYREHAERLLAEDKAYRCYCTEERLAELRKRQEAAGEPTGYDRHCRNLSPEERARRDADGLPSVVRFKTPLAGVTTLTDELRGVLSYENERVGDFVLLKSDGYPVYHFAVVVDDHLMRISHVFRGEEYISTGARDTLLHEAFGWAQPRYVHGSTVLAPDRSKLSKRHGATAVLEFRDMGIVPEALFNYLALIGASYSADREIYGVPELVELFDLGRLHAAPGIFDRQKLEWMNAHYINHVLTLEDLTDRCLPLLRDAGLATDAPPRAYVERVIGLLKDRIKLLPEVVDLTTFFFREPAPGPDDLTGKKKLAAVEAPGALARTAEQLAGLERWEDAELDACIGALAEELGVKRGPYFMTLRVAVTGRMQSPGLTATMEVLGRAPTLVRLRRAAEVLTAT